MSELRRTGGTRFNLPAVAPGAATDEPLVAAVRAAAEPDFEVLGEVARSGQDGAVLFLARARSSAGLVALRLSRDPVTREYLLELVKQLDPSLPSPEGACAKCGAPFSDWARFCSKCGTALWGDSGVHASGRAREDLRAAVEEAARGRYEILGEMGHSDGPGVVYFARDLATHRIEALRVRPEGGADEFSIGKTNVMRRLSVSVDPARAPGPPPRPAPAPAPAAAPPRPAPAPPPRPAPAPPVRPVEPRPPAAAPARPRPPIVAEPERRRSLHIPIPNIPLPDLPPVVWVLIGSVVFAILLIILLS